MTTLKRKPGNTAMTPKTIAQRQQDLRARRKAEGLTEVRGLYLPTKQHAGVKKLFKAVPAKE